MNSYEKIKKLHKISKDYIRKGFRKGQAYFNALYTIDPNLAGILTGTMYDCFYKDEVFPIFFNKIKEEWNLGEENGNLQP